MKKIIIDFDSTLAKVEALDELAKESLKKNPQKDNIVEEFKKITESGMNGEISFPESLSRRISLIKTDRKTVEKVSLKIRDNISDSVLANKKFFEKNKENIYIISGGFKELIAPSAKELGILENHIMANDFLFDENDKLIGINKDSLMAKEKGKVRQIESMKLEGDLIMIGDGWTDSETRQTGVVQEFIAYVENVYREKVVKEADKVAYNFNEVVSYIS